MTSPKKLALLAFMAAFWAGAAFMLNPPGYDASRKEAQKSLTNFNTAKTGADQQREGARLQGHVGAMVEKATFLGIPCVDSMRDILDEQCIDTPGQDPKIVLLTHVLGGFRGLLVDAVWLRAVKLQQANKFWELYQLYTWMGQLEPRLEEIWEFNGWNMSYNLVAELPDSEARWQWIQRAIEWLRDDGLKYNPRSNKIMERIAWIFFQKIGRNLDLHHFYYKHRWALIMYAVVGDREHQDMEALSKAPQKLEELLADPEVAAALSGFQLSPPEERITALDKCETIYQIPKDIIDAVRRPGTGDARTKVRNYVTAHILRTKYKMTRLDVAAGMEKDYGKFDWREPEPHAIYWSMMAIPYAHSLKTQINFDRILMYSLQETMRRGLIAYMGNDPRQPMITAFDLSKVGPLDRLYNQMLIKYDVKRDDYGAASVRDGHVQFLQEVCLELYFAGYVQEALKYYRELNDLYDKPRPRVPMEEYVMGQVKRGIDENWTHAKAREFVDGLIVQSCFYLCTNKLDESRKYENLARLAWEAYVDYGKAQAQERIPGYRNKGFETFADVEREVVRAVLSGHTMFPPGMVPTLRAILKVPEGAEKEQIDLKSESLTPKIPPSSPPPK